MKSYEESQAEKAIPGTPPKLSDVACPELKCAGEMGIVMPEIKHPELKTLSRATCGKCGWRGWV